MESLEARCNLWILTCSSTSEREKFELEDETQSCSVERDDSLLDLKMIIDNSQHPNVPQCQYYLWYQRCLGWRRLSRYWWKAGNNESSKSKEGIKELSSTTSLPREAKKAPSSTGRQQVCLLILFCSSFWKKLHLAFISASSPEKEPVLLAANFPQSLPPFKEVREWFRHDPPPSSTSCKPTRDSHGRNFTRGMWWVLATCRYVWQVDTSTVIFKYTFWPHLAFHRSQNWIHLLKILLLQNSIGEISSPVKDEE